MAIFDKLSDTNVQITKGHLKLYLLRIWQISNQVFPERQKYAYISKFLVSELFFLQISNFQIGGLRNPTNKKGVALDYVHILFVTTSSLAYSD